MSRPPVQPGAPPRHYRAPGAPAPTTFGLSGVMHGNEALAPIPERTGITAGPVAAFAIVTLTIGLVLGVLIGRASVDTSGIEAAPAITTAPTLPSAPGDTIAPSVGAEPGTELPPNQVGTLDAPIPAGDSYVIGLYTITVTGFTEDATQVILDHARVNRAPSEGEQYTIVEVAVGYQERGGLGNPATIPFTLTDGETDWPDFPSRCGIVPDDLQNAGLVRGDQVITANLCFRIDSSSAGDLLLFTDGFAGSIYFALPEG